MAANPFDLRANIAAAAQAVQAAKPASSGVPYYLAPTGNATQDPLDTPTVVGWFHPGTSPNNDEEVPYYLAPNATPAVAPAPSLATPLVIGAGVAGLLAAFYLLKR